MPQLKRMAFPVDILTNVDHEFLELAAEEYMSQILYRNPDTAEYLRLPDSKQIEIGLCNVSFVPLYGTDTKKKLLALFLPDDFTTVVGLYLLGQWWGVEDVLKTAEPSRTGLIKVSTLGERIVLYVLNRIVLRNEKSSEDVSFLCHCEHESAKILWKDGEAIGFYSYKPKGSLCRNFLTQCYQLPVMDTLFVRKCHRGKGHGVKILEDFVGSFRKEYIGLKFPLSEAIYKVCEKYFSIHPADKEILWEVEKIGSPFQRTLIANRLQKLKLQAEKDQVVSKLKFVEDAAPMEIEITKVQETIENTVEIVEETITDITKEVDDVPVSRRGRSSSLKRRGIRENSEERLSKIIIRVEDIEAGVESPIEVATEEHLDDTFSVKESETVLRSTTDTVTATVTNISELRSSQKEEEHEIEKDTATSEGTPVTHLTTAGEVKSQRGSEEECEIVNVEHTVVKQGATIGSIDQNQLQSVVDIEIVKMSTGTEEEQNENLEKNKEVEEDKPVCETEEEEIKMLDEPEEEKAMSGTVEMYNNTKAVEEATDQSETLANKAESESEVEEYREKEELKVETDSTMDAEITQGENVDVVPEISEIDQEEAPQQSSVESAEVHKWKTTPEEDQKTVENSSKMLTLSEAKVVLVDLHTLSPEEASDYNREIDIAEQDEMKHTMSSEQQAAEEIMIMEEQDGTLDTTKGYNVATDAKRTPEQSTGYKEQEGELEPETTEVVLLSQVEKPEEKTNTEQAKVDAQKKGSTDTPSRSTNLGDQTVDPRVTVRCLRSTLKQIKITPVRRSTRSKAVIQQVESVAPQHKAKFRTDERDEVIAEDVGPEESDKANTDVDETVVIESGSFELLKATEEKTPQITETTEGNIPLVEAEPDEDVKEKVKAIKKIEYKEANLAGQTNSDIEMSSLAQETDVQEEEVPVSTEINLRRRTIRVQSPLRRKSRRVQKQEAEADVDHQERHTVVTKNKTEAIPMTKERVEEIDQEVNKMENKEAKLAELEPVEEPDMIRNGDEKTSASTEEIVIVCCLPIITTETSFESLDDMANSNTVETAAVDTEKSDILMGVEIDDQEKEHVQTQEDTEMIHEEEKIEEENTVEEQKKLDKQDMTFEEQKPIEDLATMPAQNNLVESTKNDINRNEDEGVSSLTEKTEIVQITEKSADKVDQGAEKEKEQASQKSTVEATDNVIPFVEAEPEEGVVEKEAKEINKMENKETNLAVTKDTYDEAPEMGEEANLEQQKNEPLFKNEKETAETEKPMEMDPVVSKEQTNVIEGTTIQIEEVSLVESTEINQSDNARITRRSLRLSAKSVTSTQNTRKSTRLHKAELEPVKEANMSRNEYEETSAATERTVNVGIPIITVETNLESPEEIPNTNVEKTSAVGPETSVLLMGVETDNKKEAPKILEAVTLVEAEPDEEAEKDDGTPIIQLQKATVVLVDLNNLSQSTEGESDTPKVLTNSQTEEQLELDEPDKSEYQLRIQTSEHEEQQEELQKEENTEKTPVEEEDKVEEENTVEEQNKLDKQIITFEQQKLTEVLEGKNDENETEIVEEYKAVIDEDVEETVTSKEHPEATTMADKANIIKETENYQDVALKEKQTDSDVEMSSLAQEAPEAVQEILEEEVPVSTERSLRHRKIIVQSPPRRKSRRVQNQEAEADVDHQERHTVVTKNKTEAISMTEETVEEMDQEVNMRNEETRLAELEPVEEDTEKVVPLVEGEPDKDIKNVEPDANAEKGFEEINKMENKEQSLENDAAPEMEREEANLEQHENESLVSVVCKEQTYVTEETTIQVEEVSQMKISETNDNKSERITRRSLRISAQPATSTQKTRTSTRLHTAELEPVKEADRSRNEETSSTTVETVNVCVPIITVETNMESLDEDGDVVFMSRNVETTSYEQEKDISNDKGKVDEALLDKSTDEQEDETKSSIKTTENEILVEMDKTQKVVEGGVQDEEKAEPEQENADQKPEENTQQKGEDEARTSSVKEDATQEEEAVSKEENVGETNLTNEFKTTAAEGKVALESSDQEASFITRRSLRYRTVTVQSTPRRKSKRLHRQEVASEKETKDNICGNENDSAIQKSADDLNIEKENEALNAEESITEFENLKTKEGEGIIQVNIEGKAEETGTKEGNEILFEINESNSACPDNTEENKTREENLKRDVQVPTEQEEEEVSSVQAEEKPLQEKETEGAVQGSSFDLEETTVESRTLRKRLTVETAAPRKSKRLRKQEHDEDSKQVKEVMQQTETVEVTFTTENVELSSDVPAAVFEGSNLGGGTQQKIQKNAEGTKSDGDCNIHEDTKTDAGESQEKHKEKRVNKPQTDEDNDEVMEQNSRKVEEAGELEEVIEQHVEAEEQKVESSTNANEGFTLELEEEETSDQEENKADEDSRVATEAAKDVIFTSAEKSDEGEENVSDEDEKGLAIEKHVLQSSSSTSSSRRRSMRLQMHDSKKNTKEDESDSEESEEQQTAKQRKRKAITDLTPARRSKRYRAKIV
ncbi:midasin AAA ATPase-domain containing protein [Rhinichthys klamathensis goyatoka]|uniref:midasin AAA ATPase-domain containing protein n=1 Tax=Rhinichthys klamathensis goyatoka TaxID=3034132 RepID=UPI0024B4EB7E|nr:midasin AAA ATPase-domain containing protein [Rhinichthys klamathensis goyatoka]